MYGLKYNTNFNDLMPGTSNTWTVDIYENGYTGGTKAMIFGEKPVSIVYKKQNLLSPLMASELTLELWSELAGEYDEFFTAPPLQYYILISKNGSPFWYGVNTTDSYTQNHSNTPYRSSVKFNDGLGELQWHRYESSGALMAQLEQLAQVFSNCLSFLPYTLDLTELVNVREDTMNDTQGLLEQLYMDDLAFTEQGDDGLMHGINCNKLLNNMLTSMTCRMYQSAGKWWVERVMERTAGGSMYQFTYPMQSTMQTTNAFASSSNGVLNPVIAINNSALPKLINTSEEQVTQKNPSVVYTFSTSSFNNLELIPNAFFEMAPIDKWTGNLPAFWDRTADLIAQDRSDQQLEIIDPWSADPRYQTGFSFGKNAALYQNRIFFSSISSNQLPSEGYLSDMILHAVRRTGDTYTLPSVYVNGNTGSLQINFQFYFKIRLYPHYPVGYRNVSTDVSNIIGNSEFSIYPFFHLALYSNKNLVWNYLTGYNIGSAAWSVYTNAWCIADSFYYTNMNAANGYVGTSGLTQQTVSQLTAALNACIGNTSAFIDFPFICSIQADIPLTGALIHSPDTVTFDFATYPPYYDTTAIDINYDSRSDTFLATWDVEDYAIIASDIQYKDSYTSTAGFQTFYSADDNEIRWNELKISAIYGDQVSGSYPGAFRLSSGDETANWHHRGLTDTGQKFADLICKDILPVTDTYRRSMTASYLGNIEFWNSIEDTDGKIYVQTGANFDVKSGTVKINMEEMVSVTIIITVSNLGTGMASIATTSSNTSIANTMVDANTITITGNKMTAKIAPSSQTQPLNSFPS